MSTACNCPICGISDCHSKTIPDTKNASIHWASILCDDCGEFYFYLNTQDLIEPDIRFKMACLLYEKKLQGKKDSIAFYAKIDGRPKNPLYSSPCYEYKEWVKSFPADPLAKMDRALLNIKNFIGEDLTKTISISATAFSHIKTAAKSQAEKIPNEEQRSTKMMFCKDYNSAYGLAKLMGEMKYVEIRQASELQREFSIRITAKGWQRISELHDQQSENSETCFVAMAYNESTDQYREAVRKAVQQAGYRANEITVNEVHYNDFIMDKTINLINEARFVIADFTTMPEDDNKDKPKVSYGIRGGVYWEAGYARGLRKEVIHTCKDDESSRRRLHFDVEQINTLFWKEEDFNNFIDKLTQRITVTAGKGPLA